MSASKKFRIGYFADGPWSHEAFKLLNGDNSIEIAFIMPRVDTVDETLKEFALEFNIEYLFPEKINTPSFLKKAKRYNCDLFVSMSFNQIFRKPVIDTPRKKTINCHAGKLPFYRGRNILNWALINDEKEFGITVHFVDEGIDTGDIILQRTFPITDRDDYNSLLQIAYKECAFILYDAVKLIQKGKYTVTEQKKIHPVGFYCGRRGPGDEIIDWNNDSRTLFNFIRAIAAPGPKAHTTCKGNVVRINRARLVEGAPNYVNTPGQLLYKTEEGFWVKTKDSFIEILEIESDVRLRVGDKLGS